MFDEEYYYFKPSYKYWKGYPHPDLLMRVVKEPEGELIYNRVLDPVEYHERINFITPLENKKINDTRVKIFKMQ